MLTILRIVTERINNTHWAKKTSKTRRTIKASRVMQTASYKEEVIFWDCDDCLYKNEWITANLLTKRIEEFTVGRMKLPEGYAYELYKKYGTCLKGMMEEKILSDQKSVDEYLLFAHDVELEIERDYKLRELLMKMRRDGYRMYVFTASARHHARKCLELLGVEDLFLDIIDVRAVGFATKHDAIAYARAMEIAEVNDPKKCVFIDDSVSNIKTAKQQGWNTVLCGTHGRDCGQILVCEEADFIIETAHQFDTNKHIPTLANKQPLQQT
jgi:pyrimidine 5'-nucleotidase